MQFLTSVFTIIGVITVTGAFSVGLLFLLEYLSKKGEDKDEYGDGDGGGDE